MEKLENSLSKSYAAIKLYLEELDEIEAIFKSTFGEVKFIANGYSYDSLTDLRTHRQQVVIYDLEITGFRPYVNFKAGRLSVRLYSASDDSAVAGVFFKLDNILRRASRKPAFLYSYPVIFIGMTSVYISDFPSWRHFEPAIAIPAFVISPWILWVSAIRFWRSSVIILEYEARHQTFFRRNSDQLIVNFYCRAWQFGRRSIGGQIRTGTFGTAFFTH